MDTAIWLPLKCLKLTVMYIFPINVQTFTIHIELTGFGCLLSNRGEEGNSSENRVTSEVKSEESAGNSHPHPRDPVTPPEGTEKKQKTEEALAVTGLTLKMHSGEDQGTPRANGEATSRSDQVKGAGNPGSTSSRQGTPRTGQRPSSGFVIS